MQIYKKNGVYPIFCNNFAVMKEERLYIVGYMACGKTTFGRALASSRGWDFVDLDEEIERREGMSVGELMATQGEEYFRLVESETLKATALRSKVVVACGGGTPCFFDNMEFITLHGISLWLLASPERIAERIRVAGPTRPLLAGKSDSELLGHIRAHLLRRQPYYARANWRFSGEHLENEEEIAAALARFQEKFLVGS